MTTRRFVDLHTHSVASDGQLAPAEVVKLADSANLAALALTDHDTLDGLSEAAAEAKNFPEMKFIPGIEVSARCARGTMHILGLGVDVSSKGLQHICEELRSARRERNPRMIAKLQELGFDIDMEYVLKIAAGLVQGAKGGPSADRQVLGRMHMAQAMRRRGYVSTVAEAFDKYLGNGRAAYVDKERLEPRELIAAIRQAGGIASLAHPVQLKYDNRAQIERILRDLIRHGLEAIEVYHTDHDVDHTRLFLEFARRFGLIPTGGSDYHGPDKPISRLGRPRVPVAAVGEEVIARLSSGRMTNSE